METVIVTLKHAKAKQLLQDLEEMDLIKMTEQPQADTDFSSVKISELKNLMQEPRDGENIDQQIEQLRNEWERNF